MLAMFYDSGYVSIRSKLTGFVVGSTKLEVLFVPIKDFNGANKGNYQHGIQLKAKKRIDSKQCH